MGYPKYTSGLKPVCMRICKLKPMTVVKNKTDKKVINILVSELNAPICALIKDMAHGGVQGSVPITFASTETLARMCPPPPCDCKPCEELTPGQRLIKRAVLASKMIFLGGSIFLIWYIGGFGKTWDTWNLKECVKNYFIACRNIEYVYKEKCETEEEKNVSVCLDTEKIWNKIVIAVVKYGECSYYLITKKLSEILNYENCEYSKEKKKPVPQKEKPKEKEKKEDYGKIYQSLFSALDPINIECSERPDYFARLLEMVRDDEE